MRRKQMLGIILPLLLVSVATAESQLTGVKAQPSGANASAVVIQASGRFTHTEYRPNDNLLLVDLSGVSAAAIDAQPHPLDIPAVASYRVQSYTGTNGAAVARVELTLKPHAIVKISEALNALTVNVATDLPSSAAALSGEGAGGNGATLAKGKSSSTPASSPAPAEFAARAVLPRVQSIPTQVRNIAVARGERGMNIEISADGALVSKIIKLSSPDRVVVDLLNSVPATRQREITVNSGDVKMVRIGRYQTSPPTTRVVVDLTTAHEYEISNVGNKLIVKLQPTVSAFPKQAAASQVAALGSPETASPFPTVHKSDSGSATATIAKDFVVLDPTYRKELPPADLAQADSSAKVTFSSNRTGVSQPATAAPQLDNSVTAQNSLVSSMGKTDSGTAKAEPAKSVAVTELNERKSSARSEAGESRSAQAARKFTDHKNDVALTNGPVVPATANAAMKIEPALNLAALPQQAVPVATQGGPVASCNTGRYTGEPISVNLKDVDLRDFFRLIHEISGLNIILDADVRGNLTLVLDDVPWDQALSIVLKNSRLDCQLEGNILRIASSATIKAEADAHRAQIEAQALAVDKVTVTRYLSYAVASELMPAIKQFMSARGDIIADGRTNALIIQDIPATIPNIDRLIHELDRKTKEVEIEARVVAATRNFARDLGTQLGFGLGNGVFAFGGNQQVGIAPTTANNPANPRYVIVGTKQIPLFTNFPAAGPTSGLNFINATNNYRVDLVLSAAESRGLVKILSRPRIVTQNNISAIVRQGVKLPIVTAAQLGGPPTVTFVDAFLRLTVKPQITAEGTIFLNVDVENTTPDFGNQVQGNPSLITQQATTSVLVTDGGTVVIGGVIQTTSSVNVAQTPVLGNIPILGNLFKRRAIQTSTQELMFFITPRVIQT